MHRISTYSTYGVIFIFGVGAGWMARGNHLDVFFTSYVPALATLVAAFCGANYAFQLQMEKEIADNKRRNVVNANIAIFSLIRMRNKLLNFQEQIIKPHHNNDLKSFLEMPPTLDLLKDDIKLNIESLYFLLETDDRNLLGELSCEEGRYRSALDAINDRSQLHRQEIQPSLERAGFAHGIDYSEEQIKDMIGQRLYIILQESTTQVKNHVDSTADSLKKITDKLTASLKKQYPNETIIRLG